MMIQAVHATAILLLARAQPAFFPSYFRSPHRAGLVASAPLYTLWLEQLHVTSLPRVTSQGILLLLWEVPVLKVTEGSHGKRLRRGHPNCPLKRLRASENPWGVMGSFKFPGKTVIHNIHPTWCKQLKVVYDFHMKLIYLL